MYLTGIVWFALALVACGFAPGAVFLIITRVLQGVGAALPYPAVISRVEVDRVFAPTAPPNRGRHGQYFGSC